LERLHSNDRFRPKADIGAPADVEHDILYKDEPIGAHLPLTCRVLRMRALQLAVLTQLEQHETQSSDNGHSRQDLIDVRKVFE
jgi:hypothetical protein